MITTNDQTSSAAIVLPEVAVNAQLQVSRPDDEAVKASTILIVDDEPGVALVVRKYLKDAGFRKFNVVIDAKKALVHIQETQPDLILLDVFMSVNGLDILEAMRNDPQLEHIPVIVLTQSNNESIKLKALNLGASDFLTKPVVVSELVARVRNTLSTKVYRDRVVDYTLQLESDVLSDALTSIPNRRAFDYELKRRMSEWKRQKTPLGLVMIDIDHFKQFNDRYGHAAGDSALKHLASTLKRTIREMDLVARYGGEEFAVILPATDVPAAVTTCLNIQRAIANSPVVIEEQTIPLTVSAGLAVVGDADDAEFFMRRADTALYAAKKNGRNRSYRHNGSHCVALSETDEKTPVKMEDSGPDVLSAKGILDSTIAIVDDEPMTIALARKYMKDEGFTRFISITDSTKAFAAIKSEKPDLVLLDLRMPDINGHDILRLLRADDETKSTPVVVLTASKEKEAKIEALTLGANDFLEKPIEPRELLARVRNTLMAKGHVDVLKDYSARLEFEVQARTTELMASRREAVQCLARAAELRDDITGRHVIRVGRYAAIIAEELGFSEERIVWMEHAAQLHDVGKIGISDSILHKPGKLTEEEFETMKGHCVAGRSIIRNEVISDDNVQHRNVFDDWTSPLMHLASVVAATHHERWDGTGYPQALKGTDIPIEGRITAIADVFDALSTKRPYKAPIPIDECFRLLEEKRGTHFDPNVLDAFFRRRSEIIQTAIDYADPEPPK